ncbi:MAG TPA: hypothetical protein VNK67_12630, partial [Burkholderiales bacterium]|nr:hypothetical protein [Burkholderiales bacterium]
MSPNVPATSPLHGIPRLKAALLALLAGNAALYAAAGTLAEALDAAAWLALLALFSLEAAAG